jgi:hypothetical protein
VNAKEQAEQFQASLENFLEGARMEYDLKLADMIGAMSLAVYGLAQEMQTLNEMEEDEKEGEGDEHS